jgi:hypothetical protein
MQETYYAGSYWLARHESAEECARCAEALFRGLGSVDAEWSDWHQSANSFEQARKLRVDTDAATFTRMFARKEHQQLKDGFQFWLWAGSNPGETTTVNTACGSSSRTVSSACVLTPPSRGPIAERVLTAPVMTEVMRTMALAWEPEWGVATSHEHRQMVSARGKAGTFVGWVMYFSRQRGTVPPLPAPVRVEPVEDKGTLVILTPERFSVSNTEHVALAGRVHELLNAAGLLRPLQPFAAP